MGNYCGGSTAGGWIDVSIYGFIYLCFEVFIFIFMIAKKLIKLCFRRPFKHS